MCWYAVPMALQIVNIEPDSLSYDPRPPIVKPGDSVEFKMDGWEDTVTVTISFGTSSPFAQPTMTLDGSGEGSAQQTYTVRSNASAGLYPFTVTSTTRKEDPEPPGTISGDLEVSTDSPPKE
jgi:plastocyanin